jgi:carbon storage regulator
MLISRRKEGEAVLIGDNVEIRIVGIRKKKVILGIIAPRDVRISTVKLSEAELENTMAAAHSVEIADLLPAKQNQEPVLFLLDTKRPKPGPTPPISDMEKQHE